MSTVEPIQPNPPPLPSEQDRSLQKKQQSKPRSLEGKPLPRQERSDTSRQPQWGPEEGFLETSPTGSDR
jgi:hypothetical protein